MAEEPEAQGEADAEVGGSGSYEVLRGRMMAQAQSLADRAKALNEKRQGVFGGTELAVVGNSRVRTDNNCVPRDIVQVGGKLLFGYNVHMGLRQEVLVGDVFSVHELKPSGDDIELPAVAVESANYLQDELFQRHFHEQYKYYADARLVQLRAREGRLLAIFQVGQQLTDVRVFRWALAPSGKAEYVDNRGEREHVFPPSHDFEWVRATRDDQVQGRHPHLNILDTIFVETLGGSLTVKIEDNTDVGQGIYSEPVEEEKQSIDDAEFHYARVGVLILLKVRPYNETADRYLVYNTRTQHVTRLDAIGQACIQLPEDHGLIFPGGYYLQDGETKVFEGSTENLKFIRRVQSPNGEDVLYVFYEPVEGRYVLLPYNLIRKEVARPIHCHGYCLFDDGKLVIFRSTSEEPTRVHPMQVWATPFCSDEFAAAAPTDGSYLGKVGNKDLVRGISDMFTVVRLVQNLAPSRQVFEDVVSALERSKDAYYWLGHEDAGNLLEVVEELRQTAELVVDEFEKVQAIRKRAAEALTEARTGQVALFQQIRSSDLLSVDAFMSALTKLRAQRGHLITLRDQRYIDLEGLEALETEAVEYYDDLSKQCVEFLLDGRSLEPLLSRLEELNGKIVETEKSHDLEPLAKDLSETSEGVNVLSEVVSGLNIDDPVARARILEGISEVFGQLNRVRAVLDGRQQDIAAREGRAEFSAQFQLFSQSVSSAISQATSPASCDDQLSRLMVQLEELESRFGEFDEFIGELTSKRGEVQDAFSAKKQQLMDEQQRRASTLMSAASRIFEGIGRRVRTFKEVDDLNAYFAADAMVLKVRDLADRLRDLNDSVHAEELESKLKSARQDALRSLRDKKDLFEGGDNLLRFGRHRFSVNTQALELTMVPRNGELVFHLTGTDYYGPITVDGWESTRPFWDQALISETPDVYRGEYLAASMLFAAEERRDGLTVPKLLEADRAPTKDAAHSTAHHDGLLQLVREYAQGRYEEGYERGVHDADGTRILSRLLSLYSTAGLLRHAPGPRSLACLYWAHLQSREERDLLRRKGRSLGRLRQGFMTPKAYREFEKQLTERIGAFLVRRKVPHTTADVRTAGRYLAEELGDESPRFVTSAEAAELRDGLLANLTRQGLRHDFDEDLRVLGGDLAERLELARAWIEGYLETGDDELGLPRQRLDELRSSELEAATLLVTDTLIDRETSAALSSVKVTELLGRHPRIQEGTMVLRLDAFLGRLGAYLHEHVPAYEAYKKLRSEVVDKERRTLRLEELKPRVLSSFVRNKLLDEVYLPLIGENLAKQIGAAGDAKRTDRMGLLLMISPPGYGKTTLMEYVANRLGLTFMKVNGPSLGHNVVSFDPAEAGNATARQEVEKINLSFEMGNNVMLYLDDVQHTNPELLQKFISLCDGQRRVEGVWRGQSQTYDLRGKRFCVVMAGNPYTETGEKFTIPDMLANRADTYNLGDVLEGKGDQFALSYIENCLTSNTVLAPIAARSQEDVYRFVRMAKGEEIPTSELSHQYSAVEAQEIVGVLKKLFVCQDVLLKVNQEYIRSASMEDAYRTEPPFKLQGSYRNMNKLAEKVVPAMNDRELEGLIDDHYAGESQTLTTGAEQNLLKLAEMRGRLSEVQAKRWEQIKRDFSRIQSMGGQEDDPVARVTGTLGGLGKQLEAIKDALDDAVDFASDRYEDEKKTAEQTRAEAALRESQRPEEDDAALAARHAEVAAAQSKAFEKLAAELGPRLEALEAAISAQKGKELAVTVPGLDDLLQRQLNIVERTVYPLVNAMATRTGNVRELQDQISDLFQQIGELQQNLGRPPGPRG